MTISLVDVAKYYSGVNHQKQALLRLQQQIDSTNSALLADDSEFARLWRNQVVVNSDFLITSDGIGPAKIGDTYGQIKQALGADYSFIDEPSFMVDLSAIAVLREGISAPFGGQAVAFYLVYNEGDPLTDSTPINLIVTSNPNYHTAEGTGPGTLLANAVRDYGKITLGFNTQAESREFASFERGPARLDFRTEALTHGFAGDYSVPDAIRGEFNQTSAFFENASISQVWVRGDRP